jgi:DNA-binding PadR family transcriptional regulator
MSDCDRVLERLYECRDSGKHLELHDFVDLGLSNNVIGECLEDLHSLGWAYALVHKSSRDNSGVERIVAQITDEGKEEFERRR